MAIDDNKDDPKCIENLGLFDDAQTMLVNDSAPYNTIVFILINVLKLANICHVRTKTRIVFNLC